MDSYKLRVTLSGNIDTIMSYITEVAEMYIVVREGNMKIKDHLHLWLYGHPTRYMLSKVCGKGNQSYSLSKCKERYPLEYWSYMCKQNEPEWVNVPEKQRELFEEYMRLKKEKIKIKNDLKVWEVIMESVLIDWDDKETCKNCDEYIMNKVIEYHKNHKKIISKHRVFSYVDTIIFNIHKRGMFGHDMSKEKAKKWLLEYRRVIE